MRGLVAVLVPCGFLFFSFFAKASDSVTNIVSAMVSYQAPDSYAGDVPGNGGISSGFASYYYPDDASTAALGRGGFTSKTASYMYCQDSSAPGLFTASGAVSRPVSYRFRESYSQMVLVSGGIVSPLMSYQFLEWPDTVVDLYSSPLVSYYYQSSLGPGLGSIAAFGAVRDAAGAPISGATVYAMVLLSPKAQAITDSLGNYSLGALPVGIYDLWVVASGYQTAIRGITIQSGTAREDFQLARSPSPPATQPSSRTPNFVAVNSDLGSLRIFNGSQFVPIVSGSSAPITSIPTIVLTHGWIPLRLDGTLVYPSSGITNWPTTLASQLTKSGISVGSVNILAWDWFEAAEGLSPPSGTTESGLALGRNLLKNLGPGYSSHIHFVGHSLGTMVNAAAANYLHGDRVANDYDPNDVSPTPWPASLTHMTLLDHADVANSLNPGIVWDGITTFGVAQPGVLGLLAPTLFQWSSPIPNRAAWIDNYISLFGYYRPEAVNVALQNTETYTGFDAHSYPIYWYGLSVASPTDCLLGFQRSFEYLIESQQSPLLFPSGQFSAGSAYHQVTSSSDPLALEPAALSDAPQFVVPLIGKVADYVVDGAENTIIQTVGTVSTEIADGSAQAQQWAQQSYNYLQYAAAQGVQAAGSWVGGSSLRLIFQSPSVGLAAGSSGQPVSGAALPPAAWVSVAIPTNASGMAFDFNVAGDPGQDIIACAIGTNTLFSLPAKFVPTNSLSSSSMIDVSAWSGTTNEIFFGFLGGSSTNASLIIENIRFFSFAPPQLRITAEGGSRVGLRWPSGFGGYAVEQADLVSGPWQMVTNAVTVSGTDYLIETQPASAATFYRLKRPW